MKLIEWFSYESCKGTELVQGWYWYEDDGEGIGGPFQTQEEAYEATQKREGW